MCINLHLIFFIAAINVMKKINHSNAQILKWIKDCHHPINSITYQLYTNWSQEKKRMSKLPDRPSVL